MLNEFNILTIKEQAAMLKQLRAIHKQSRLDYKNGLAALRAEKAEARLQKAQAKAQKQEQAILRAQLRLQKLLEKQAAPVGIKAKKAAKRPSKAVVTYGSEDNAIAAAIMAKKAKA